MTIEELNNLRDEWSSSSSDIKRYLRFGQFVFNELNLSEPDPKLFYEEDESKAYSYALEKYVVWDQN